MTTLIGENQEPAQATAPPSEPKATTKATAAPRKPRVAPSKGKSGRKTTAAKKRAKAPKKAKSAKAEGIREGSKTGKILDLLKRPDGATLQELRKLSGWQAHSVRGFLSGTVGKKMGLAVTSTRGEDGTRNTRSKPESKEALFPGRRIQTRRLLLCAEHVRQLGGESPLDNLMEVKS